MGLAAVLVLLLAAVALHLEPPSISFLSWMLMTLLPVELKMILQEQGLEESAFDQRDVHFVYLVAYRSSGFGPTRIRLDHPEVQACPIFAARRTRLDQIRNHLAGQSVHEPPPPPIVSEADESLDLTATRRTTQSEVKMESKTRANTDFQSGIVSPAREERKRIRAQLELFGEVGDANVYYWLQNRKS